MKKIIKTALATTVLASALVAAAPAFADDTPALKITGSATIASEYRLRGISQTDSDPAIQGGITLTTAPGFYVGTWASNLAGNGTFGGSNMELDLIAGYSKAIGPATLDGGLIYYVYPGTKGHDFFEIYGSVSGAVGPVNAKLGAYWAPPQTNIGISGGSKGNNIWVYTDLGLPISGTPITLKAHAGYSDGDSLYTKGAAAFDPFDTEGNHGVFDYAVGVDLTYKALTLNVSYVGTDLNRNYANLNYGAGSHSGRKITKGDVVASLTAAF